MAADLGWGLMERGAYRDMEFLLFETQVCGIFNHYLKEPMAIAKCVRDSHTNGLTCGKIHHMAATMGALASLCVLLVVLCLALCSPTSSEATLAPIFQSVFSFLSHSRLVTVKSCSYFTTPLKVGHGETQNFIFLCFGAFICNANSEYFY